MVKRFNKKQGSKQGIILLTVVFILAMAVIFISACMLMTRATRDRMYWKAEQSQARLTVTSAAEAFYQALEVGDFKESDLKTLAKGSAAGIYMTATDGSGKCLPGMGTTSDNCTLLSLKAKDADCSEIYAYLTTTIGDEKESVKITFKVKSKPKVFGLFNNPVDYNGSPHKFNFNDVGYVVGGGKKDDNFLIIRGNANVDDASTKLWSSVVFAGGTVTDFRADMLGGADVIFLENSKLGTIGNTLGNSNYWYFVGTSGSSEAFSSNTMVNQLGSKGVFFANRSTSYSLTNTSNVPIYTISLDNNYNATGVTQYAGSLALADDALSTAKDNAGKYASDDFKNSVGEFPTTSQAFAQIKLGDDPLPTTAPSTFTTYSFNDFITTYGNTSATNVKVVGDTDGNNSTIEVTNIKISTGSGIGTNLNNGTRRIFILDGNTDYVIYFGGSGTTYGLYQATFAVVNPNPDHQQVIVLENGVKLAISCNNGGDSYINGFLSVPRGDYSTTPEAYVAYLLGENLGSEMTATSGATNPGKFSSYWDSTTKPTLYVLGAGSNNVDFDKGTVFEGYMGLFNPNDTTTSTIKCGNGNEYVYGRLMFDGWNSGGGGSGGDDAGNLNMPYCPGPDSGGNKPPVELYKFGYSVVSVDYYFTE